MRAFTAVLLLCLIPLVGCSGDEDTIIDSAELEEAAAGANTDAPEGPYAIAFSRGDEIFVMDADGSNQTQLTFNDYVEEDAVFSPDGRYIAFSQDRDVVVMNTNGEIKLRATFPFGCTNLEWSPDSRHLVFTTLDVQDNPPLLYVISLDDESLSQLTFEDVANPAWSPDGRRIAFDTSDGIFVMDADGGNQALITGGNRAKAPTWSPDGRRIAFIGTGADFTESFDKNWSLFVMNADGSSQTPLTFSACAHVPPVWSPDGSQIAFLSNEEDGKENIFVVNDDGSNLTQLTFDGCYDFAWSPDGRYITYDIFSMEEMKHFIFRINPDGSDRIQLTIEDSSEHTWVSINTSPSEPISEIVELRPVESLEQLQVVVDTLRLRERPGTAEDVVGIIEKHEIVEVLGYSLGYAVVHTESGEIEEACGWAEIRTEAGLEGWSCVELDGETFLAPVQMRVVVDILHLRDKPNADIGEQVGLLEKDDVVEVLQRWDNWVQVQTESGLEGWSCVELDGKTFLTPAR